MTDAATIEKIARAMCKRLGENPDFKGFRASNWDGGPCHPNWWRYSARVANELVRRAQQAKADAEAAALRDAIREVMGDG